MKWENIKFKCQRPNRDGSDERFGGKNYNRKNFCERTQNWKPANVSGRQPKANNKQSIDFSLAPEIN